MASRVAAVTFAVTPTGRMVSNAVLTTGMFWVISFCSMSSRWKNARKIKMVSAIAIDRPGQLCGPSPNMW